jgi:hypothetical protein
MLPSLRLLIAAMLATIVMLICGFGVFAAFRVSRDPIAHLPAAAAPVQSVAEASGVSPALLAAHESTDQRSQFDVPIGTAEEIAPASSATEQDAAAEPATDELPVAMSASATQDAASRAAPDLETEEAAATPSEPPAAPSSPVSQSTMPLQSGDRRGDVVANFEDDVSLRPVAQIAEPSTTAAEKAIAATTATKTAAAEDMPPGKTVAALDPQMEPVARGPVAVERKPDDAAGRSGPEMRAKPPLPRALHAISHAPPPVVREEPRRIERPVRRLSAIPAAKPRRAHAIVRTVRTVRLTSPYYAQYAQSAPQSYGYGQNSAEAASEGQGQVAVRRVVRLRAARPVTGKVTSAIGGPFVRAPNQ